MREKEREETKGVSVRERKRKKKKGWPYRHLLPPADTQVLWDFTPGLQRREDWNSALPEQNKNSSSLPRGGDQSLILSSG